MGISKFAAIAIGCIGVVLLLFVARAVLRGILRILLRVKVRPGVLPTLRDRILLRYQNQDTHAWMFAWFKTRMDAMFNELPEFLKSTPNIRTILDLGCGFGMAGSFLLESIDRSEIFAIDPSPTRVRVAARALGDRGHVFQAAAPDFEVPALPTHFDAVFILDVIHFLSDADLRLTLTRLRARMVPGGHLFIRASIPPAGEGSLVWNLYRIHYFAMRSRVYFRTVEETKQRIAKGGFEVVRARISGGNPELFWFIAMA